MNLSTLFNIQKGITAIIGGGGKTTLMMTLARELSDSGSVIVTTSTKIFPPDNMPVLLDASDAAIRKALQRHRIICVASAHSSGKLAEPPCPFRTLAGLADYVLVEADGSKGLPMKAHAAHEPVIPPDSEQVIYVVGADGFGKPILAAAHRPELFAAITGSQPQDEMTPELAAQAILTEQLGQTFFLNKAESNIDFQNAARFASALNRSIIAGSLHKGEYICL